MTVTTTVTPTISTESKTRTNGQTIVFVKYKNSSKRRAERINLKNHLAFRIALDGLRLSKMLCGKLFLIDTTHTDFQIKSRLSMLNAIINDLKNDEYGVDNKICQKCVQYYIQEYLPLQWKMEMTESKEKEKEKKAK